MTQGPDGEQLALVPEPAPATGAGRGKEPAAAGHQPVAEVLVDTPLAHLDRPFEYTVPPEFAETAVPGARVRVRFAGKELDGFITARKEEAEHVGTLAPLRRVVSPEPVLTPHLAQLCRDLADHYAGSMADVVRLAVPPRHARAEGAAPTAKPVGQPIATPPGPELSAWADYPAGAALLHRLAAGGGPAAAWTARPDAGLMEGWPAALAQAVAATRASGRGSVLVLPDHRDVDRLAAALDDLLGAGSFVRLTADLGPEQRYSAWLRALRGHADIVIGTRSAAFAPVTRLGLVAWWDDGDDLLQEPRSPYPHVREVLRRRAALTGAGLLTGGYTRSPAVQHWVGQGWLRPVDALPAVVRRDAPRVVVAGEGHQERSDPAAARARIPSVAWRAVKEALQHGPVLVQVPRRGYLVGLSCQHCRTPVRCAACEGPVRLAGPDDPAGCAWCGTPDGGRPCRHCGETGRRSSVVGERRTAEEIGRAFTGVPVRSSRGGQVLGPQPDAPSVVVATPGAEPVARGGYAAALLLDGWALLDRAGLDSAAEAYRRWTAAAALTRSGEDGGRVVLAGVPTHAGLRPVEALVRWAPGWLAEQEHAERVELGLPPARRTATVTGEAAVVAEVLSLLGEIPGVSVLGPLTVPSGVQAVLRAEHEPAPLVEALRSLRAARSARRVLGDLRIRLDPVDLGE